MKLEDIKTFNREDLISTKIDHITELLYVACDCNNDGVITGTQAILTTVTEYLLPDLENTIKHLK